jgi:DNA-binding winged helix-turn-helix (wHTH) protein/Flp pilus assembly protein TadD/TolB-like protein
MRGQIELPQARGLIELAAVADFSLGTLLVQPSIRRVSVGAREELVEPRVMQVLVALTEANGSVVSRDALTDRCWGGRIVGEDAINRCIARVRRLADITVPPAFTIETVSKVGYRLKPWPVHAAAAQQSAFSAEAAPFPQRKGRDAAQLPWPAPDGPLERWQPAATSAAPQSATRARLRVRLVFAAAAACAALVAARLVLAPAAPPADRMTLRIDPFTPSGEPSAADLASKFSAAAVERLSQSELLHVSTAAASGDTVAPRYIMSGTIHTEAGTAKITAQVVERPTGHLVYTAQTQQPAGIDQQAVYAATVRLTAAIEGEIRETELARYHGPPRDVQDMVLQASHYTDDWAPYQEAPGLALGEQALAREPDNISAQAVMAVLLYLDFMARDASKGDAEGQRALALIESVLRAHPRNLIKLHLRAALLAALGDLHGAQSAAESALADEPENPGMRATLSGALLQQGDVAGSIRVLPNGEDPSDDFPAMQAFAQGRYEDALATMRRVSALEPPEWTAQVFLAGTLAQTGRLQEARAMMVKLLPCLPPELRRVSALRQGLYKLPDPGWGVFRESLRKAGMPS